MHICTEPNLLIWTLLVSAIASVSESPSAMSRSWRGARSRSLQEVTCFAGHACGRGPRQHQQLLSDPCHHVPPLPTVQEGKSCAAPADLMLKGSFSWSKSCQEGLESWWAPVRSAQTHLSGPGGGKGESYCTVIQDCFTSLELELAFQPWDTIRASSDYIFSWAMYSQGCWQGQAEVFKIK